MRIQNAATAIALLGVCLPGFGQTHAAGAAGGVLTGKVVDDVDNVPLPGASVEAVQVDGKSTRKTLTERDGSYKIAGLPARAKFKVIYKKENYVPALHEIVVTANQDGRLLKLRGNQAYYEKKADKIKETITQTAPNRKGEEWEEQWMAVVLSPIPPVAKGWIARALQPVAPPSRNTSTLFAAYATADPKSLNDLLVEMESSSGHVVAWSSIDSSIRANVKTSKALAAAREN